MNADLPTSNFLMRWYMNTLLDATPVLQPCPLYVCRCARPKAIFTNMGDSFRSIQHVSFHHNTREQSAQPVYRLPKQSRRIQGDMVQRVLHRTSLSIWRGDCICEHDNCSVGATQCCAAHRAHLYRTHSKIPTLTQRPAVLDEYRLPYMMRLLPRISTSILRNYAVELSTMVVPNKFSYLRQS
jgi:hypothetical protein